MRCGCSGSSRSRSRIGTAVADPAHKDAYHWVVVRHEIDYLRAAHEGDLIIARTWVGEAPQGRAVRPPHGIHRAGREAVRAGADPMGDHRQGAGPADPGAAAKSWRRSSSGRVSSRHMTRPILYDYFRSSAAYRVRIALNLKGVDYERPADRPSRGRAEIGRISRAQPARAGADARDRRSPADAEPGDHQLSRHALSQSRR